MGAEIRSDLTTFPRFVIIVMSRNDLLKTMGTGHGRFAMYD